MLTVTHSSRILSLISLGYCSSVEVTNETKTPLESCIPNLNTSTSSTLPMAIVNEDLATDVENNSSDVGFFHSIDSSAVLVFNIASNLLSRKDTSGLINLHPRMAADVGSALSEVDCSRSIDPSAVLFSSMARSFWSPEGISGLFISNPFLKGTRGTGIVWTDAATMPRTYLWCLVLSFKATRRAL